MHLFQSDDFIVQIIVQINSKLLAFLLLIAKGLNVDYFGGLMKRLREKTLNSIDSEDTKVMSIDVVVAFVLLTLERYFFIIDHQKSFNDLFTFNHSFRDSKKHFLLFF